MQITTKYFGEVEVDKENIIQFPIGIPGFSEEKEFITFDLPGNTYYQILQSIKTAQLAFIVTNPYLFYRDYSFDLDQNMIEVLQIKSEKDVVVLSIVTLKEPFESSTMNLKAPIIINSRLKLGKQYILNDEGYLIKAPIIPAATTDRKGD